ncbi:MAG: amidohydrolase family protein [Ferruginibacter sp.]
MFRKFTADKIFNGTSLLTGKVLIASREGKIIDLVDQAEGGEGIEKYSGIISPGFINCHCHTELSHLKNKIPKHSGLVDFVLAVMKGRHAPPEEIKEAIIQAEKELYFSGTSAVADICNTADSFSLKQNSKLHWHNFIEVSGFVNSTADERFEQAKIIEGKFAKLPFRYSIVPHAPYSVSNKLFQLINENSRGLLSIHNQETNSENELYLNKSGELLKLYKTLGIDINYFEPTGKTSFQSWLPYFTHHQNIISVHNTHISQHDLNASRDVSFCICINANLYIENTLPPLPLLIENKCAVVLGTDSYASNIQLNMVEEMKTIQQHFEGIDTSTLLQWATSNGAVALGISETFGSFKPGKTPGIVLIEEMDTNFTATSKGKRLL